MKLVGADSEIIRAWATLMQTEDWRVVEKDLRRALNETYRDATARIDTAQRDWMAGRAATLQELLDNLDRIKAAHHGRRMPPVVFQGTELRT